MASTPFHYSPTIDKENDATESLDQCCSCSSYLEKLPPDVLKLEVLPKLLEEVRREEEEPGKKGLGCFYTIGRFAMVNRAFKQVVAASGLLPHVDELRWASDHDIPWHAYIDGSCGWCEETLEHHEHALAISRKALGEEHPDVGDTLFNMAIVYKAQQHYSDAASTYAAAADTYAEAYGEEHEETLNARRAAETMRSS